MFPVQTLNLQPLLQRALAEHQAGRLPAAEALYRQVLAVQPAHPDALHLLGLIGFGYGRTEEALGLVRQALALQPGWPHLHHNAGRICRALRRIPEALAHFRQALALDPQLAETHRSLGDLLICEGAVPEGLTHAARAVSLRADSAEAQATFTLALLESGQLEAAIRQGRLAVSLAPGLAEAHAHLGEALRRAGHFEAARDSLQRAATLEPGVPRTLVNLGNAWMELQRPAAARACYQQVVELQPENGEAWANLGSALSRERDRAGARRCFEHALRLCGNSPVVLSNLSCLLQDEGDIPGALECLTRAAALDPRSIELRWNLAILRLVAGDYERGWEDFELRRRLRPSSFRVRALSAPEWNGEPLEGRTILLHAEQGFGDTVMMARYLPLIAARGGRIVLAAQRELRELLRGRPEIAGWIEPDEPAPAIDVHCRLMSLPRAFRTTTQTIPSQAPYLTAPAEQVERWRLRLQGLSGLKVGVTWAGSAENTLDHARSASWVEMAPLLRVPGVQFISLQKDAPAEAGRTFPQLHDWMAECEDFAATAGLIANLDLVLSVDTAVAHLTGALGQPVWVLLAAHEWRWREEGGRCLWYPTARLFRQEAAGVWSRPVERAAAALAALATGA